MISRLFDVPKAGVRELGLDLKSLCSKAYALLIYIYRASNPARGQGSSTSCDKSNTHKQVMESSTVVLNLTELPSIFQKESIRKLKS